MMDKLTEKIVEKYWPGPLTLILKLKDLKLKKSLNLEEKIAIRIPNSECTLKLLKECNLLVGTSANISGDSSFTDPQKCMKNVKNYDAFVDGGKITSKGESTIIEIENEKINVIREGALKKRGYQNLINLIITCARNLEGETEEEIIDILDELGDPEVKISVSNMSGIITIETKLDPIEVVRKMKEMLLDEPWSVRYCLRVIPIQKVVETNLEKIQEYISSISNNIENNESYRILIEKRNSDISSKEIIKNIANEIKNKVSLDFPDKIILIEILGIFTGISLIKKSDIFSLEKTKRSMSE